MIASMDTSRGTAPISADSANLADRFAASMDRLGPFEPRPHLAVAVSGGADSMALCRLAMTWTSYRSGGILALTVDHGLRPGSDDEADATLAQLARFGIPGRKLSATGLFRGPALAERARAVRYRLLLDACADAGIPHLLLAHHRGDQVETVMTRALSGSGSAGLAGMQALRETSFVRVLRPLLDIPAGALRQYLMVRGVSWIEDPSNRDPAARRARLRQWRNDAAGTSEGTLAVSESARRAGEARAYRDRSVARVLAERAAIYPEGYAVLTPGPINPEALSALLAAIAGAPFAAPIDRVADLARDLCPVTIGGVRVMVAGRLGPGWLVVRERRAMEAPVAARAGAVWDGRFRLAPPQDAGHPANVSSRVDVLPFAEISPDREQAGPTLGALGDDASAFRDRTSLPAAILHALPAVRLDSDILAIPHIGVGDPRWRVVFDPRNRAAGAPFPPG
jgi:tRNA(Ile)-lysidine synthase